MAEYTYKDVIIDPEDPRVEIGKEYYWGESPRKTIDRANNKGCALPLFLVDRDEEYTFPFYFCQGGLEGGSHFLILKKEPEKKYVPFDLSNEEVRKSLEGRWIKSTDCEYQISGFHSYDGEDGTEWNVVIAYKYISPEVLLALWKFDDGTPCGKLVEVEEE